MATYSKNELTEMAYRYLVQGKTQSVIEQEMGLPKGTISRELKPFGITGRENNEGRGGWGQVGNHCGIASPRNMGFEVTRDHVYQFLYGNHNCSSDAEFFAQLKQKYDNNSSFASDDAYCNNPMNRSASSNNGVGNEWFEVINRFFSNTFSNGNSNRANGNVSWLSNRKLLLIIIAIVIIIFRKQLFAIVLEVVPILIALVLAYVIIRWFIKAPINIKGVSRSRRKGSLGMSQRRFSTEGIIPAAFLWIIAFGGLKNGATYNTGSTILALLMIVGGFFCLFPNK